MSYLIMKQSYVAIVGSKTDKLSKKVESTLSFQDTPVMHISPEDLGDLHVSLQGERFNVKGLQVRGILFRASPHSAFCESFVLKDQHFCDAEVRATWLAAFHLDSVLAINKYDAAAWFEGASWPVWRRRLIRTGIPVSSFQIGDVITTGLWFWYPYGSCIPRSAPKRIIRRIMGTALTLRNQKQTCLIVCNEVIAGEANSVVLDTYKLLEENGVCIAEIGTDSEGNIIYVNTQPKVLDSTSAEQAAHLIVGKLHAHLYHW